MAKNEDRYSEEEYNGEEPLIAGKERIAVRTQDVIKHYKNLSRPTNYRELDWSNHKAWMRQIENDKGPLNPNGTWCGVQCRQCDQEERCFYNPKTT